ncbi:MAG: M23 family metallopeptidase [Xanthomonadales bacterium]|nr:M23 family metallopeptidase [Gammaproteobacteria bacterium]MBT8052580.1 M23 family metallopeptidase [Gammaproteobacteria bacterium]NND56661.1 M23 family metallopeptidase [Xanthomonadales bacterium]NNK52397.1 M23 family metallopeptidase [Xanthomonadales bacterium]
MQRTSATSTITSPGAFRGLSSRVKIQRVLLLAAFCGCGALMFLFGRSTAPAQTEIVRSISMLQAQIQQQQGKVDRLSKESQQNVNALAARVAELQAASTRLDALGERLANMGQLSLDEFDFSEPAPLGGPGDDEPVAQTGEDDLGFAIAALGNKLRRQSSQLDTLQFLMANRQLENDLTPAGWPVRKGWISSRYGERNDPFTGEREKHSGLDFAGTRGTEVLSVASGVVIWAANRSGYGKTVEIDHGNGYRTRYAHSDELIVRAGEHVNAGQVIALMGSTGRASAPHVHFEVLKNGSRINPARFVSDLR